MTPEQADKERDIRETFNLIHIPRTMTFYQARVWVDGVDGYKYHNKLATPKTSRAEAEADIAVYLDHKKNGTGGFRKGVPGRTFVDVKTVVLGDSEVPATQK